MNLTRTQNDYVLKSRILGDNVRGGAVGRWDACGQCPKGEYYDRALVSDSLNIAHAYCVIEANRF